MKEVGNMGREERIYIKAKDNDTEVIDLIWYLGAGNGP